MNDFRGYERAVNYYLEGPASHDGFDIAAACLEHYGVGPEDLFKAMRLETNFQCGRVTLNTLESQWQNLGLGVTRHELLAKLAWTPGQARAEVSSGRGLQRDRRFARFDENLFRLRPLTLVEGEFIAPDPTLLLEWVWVYVYEAMRSLHANTFVTWFGQTFESHVGEVLRHIHGNDRVFGGEELKVSARWPGKMVDWFVDLDDRVLLIECKAKRMPFHDLGSYSDDDYHKKATMPLRKGLEQIQGVMEARTQLAGHLAWLDDGRPLEGLIMTSEPWWLNESNIFRECDSPPDFTWAIKDIFDLEREAGWSLPSALSFDSNS